MFEKLYPYVRVAWEVESLGNRKENLQEIWDM